MNTKKILLQRAHYINKIRDFFASRSVLEVSTPVMAKCGVTDPYMANIECRVVSDNSVRFLQTSPEYAMKKLLAMGVGSIYQICPAFRDDVSSEIHRAEFTMLEWYRIGYDYNDLMQELIELLQFLQPSLEVIKISYRDLFLKYLDLDPFTATDAIKQRLLTKHVGDIDGIVDFDDAIMSLILQPLIKDIPAIIVHNYPAFQASLSKLSTDMITAERFELFLSGVEIANGFTELLDPKEQLQRFEKDLLTRKLQGLALMEIDKDFIASLEQGLPPCAGVAIGIDRLLMAIIGCSLQELNPLSIV